MTNNLSSDWELNSSLCPLVTKSKMNRLEVTDAYCGRKALNLSPTGRQELLRLGVLLRRVKQDTPPLTFAPCPMFLGSGLLFSQTLLSAPLTSNFFFGPSTSFYSQEMPSSCQPCIQALLISQDQRDSRLTEEGHTDTNLEEES